jgi:SSS family solute:Na+ symporter
VPGIIGYVLLKDEVFSAASAAGVSKPGDMALSVLIQTFLPVGLQGLFLSALIAALMSTIAAALNSVSTLVSVDIYKRLKPSVPDKRLITVGRITALGIMFLAALWSTQGDKFSSIFEAINKIAAALAPSVATVLLMGVIFKRGTRQASFYTLIIGLILGLTAFALDFAPISGRMILTDDIGIPFMAQAFILFIICNAIYWGFSFGTPNPDIAITDKYCWNTPAAWLKGKLAGWTDPRILAVYLALSITILYFIFSGAFF